MSAPAKTGRKARGGRAGQGWCMPRLVQDFGLELLAQQLWCWGRDIVHPDGNLLVEFGFERHRYSGKSERTTCYRLDDGELHICLWGMFFGRRELGGLYLGRLDFCPTWAPIESLSAAIHRIADLPSFVRPRGREQWQCARTLWTSQQKWIADYELWITDITGVEHREECVDSWMRPFVGAERMSPAWQFLSQRGWEGNGRSVMKSLKEYILPAVFE